MAAPLVIASSSTSVPGMDGLTLRRNWPIGLPFAGHRITGHGDASLARQAFKASAVIFSKKPIDGEKRDRRHRRAFRREEGAV
jgi:FixJ family two-component response regulator